MGTGGFVPSWMAGSDRGTLLCPLTQDTLAEDYSLTLKLLSTGFHPASSLSNSRKHVLGNCFYIIIFPLGPGHPKEIKSQDCG